MFDSLEKPGPAEREMLARGEIASDNMWWAWWGNFRNFGDWIGPYLYRQRTGRLPRYCAPGHVPEGVPVHFTCGSIMHKIRRKNRAVVWGTGIKEPDAWFARPLEMRAVRGPLTQQVLDSRRLDVPEVIGDPGLCLPRFHMPASTGKTYRLGLIPHVYDMPFWKQNGNLLPADAVLIDLTDPFESVIDVIASCEATLSTSLHGLIVSHAYGVPTCWTASFSAELENDFKFRDYFQSVGLDLSASDRRKIALPFDLGDYADDLTLPAVDVGRMADRLLAACPF
ncbi:polysaccharide pyruvyl transferase family protein [Paracoccus luteus]|uniref:polysaccharide pyruvyl transferase family protein n=1 Tax=Paracoccus luteus TaxID=2508543 RepID=UPI0014315CDA|nr:polysaccharide pyruvyl transferase family protein [Paracoccus luteus]